MNLCVPHHCQVNACNITYTVVNLETYLNNFLMQLALYLAHAWVNISTGRLNKKYLYLTKKILNGWNCQYMNMWTYNLWKKAIVRIPHNMSSSICVFLSSCSGEVGRFPKIYLTTQMSPASDGNLVSRCHPAEFNQQITGIYMDHSRQSDQC